MNRFFLFFFKYERKGEREKEKTERKSENEKEWEKIVIHELDQWFSKRCDWMLFFLVLSGVIKTHGRCANGHSTCPCC